MAVIYGDDLANDLSGTAGADSIYGLGGDDTLRADFSAGGAFDFLSGGVGDDFYRIEYNSGTDQFVRSLHLEAYVDEKILSGNDSLDIHAVRATSVVYLPLNVENFFVTGKISTVIGTDQDNVVFAKVDDLGQGQGVVISAKGGDDVLYGSDFDDLLDGGIGVDGMVGGKGDDCYRVDSRDDIVIEYSGEGDDVIESMAASYRISNNVETLELVALGVQTGNGNGAGNLIVSHVDFTKFVNAGGGNDIVKLFGAADDLVNGGQGDDTLQAGLGDDIYRTSGNFGRDEITDIGGDDAVEFDVNESTLWFSKNGNDLNVSVIGTQNGVTIKNWYSDSAAKIEEFYSGTGKMLTAAKVDSLVNAMSGFAQPSSTTLPANIQTALAPTLAAAWQ